MVPCVVLEVVNIKNLKSNQKPDMIRTEKNSGNGTKKLSALNIGSVKASTTIYTLLISPTTTHTTD